MRQLPITQRVDWHLKAPANSICDSPSMARACGTARPPLAVHETIPHPARDAAFPTSLMPRTVLTAGT